MYYNPPPPPAPPRTPPPHTPARKHTAFKFYTDTAHDHRTRDGASVIAAFLSKFHFYNLSVSSLFKRHNHSETVNNENTMKR